MSGRERALLYRMAIQTGLRANELRSLTRGGLHLESQPPYCTCKAGSTKNRKDARLYIQAELALQLKAHIAQKLPQAPVFGLPHRSNMARMRRDDLARSRKQWLAESKGDLQEYIKREQGDFRTEKNHEGESIDFHSLRHTCWPWLAMTGAPAKVVQEVMRHQSITLTMDTYGHLFPGQEAEAVARMHLMLDPPTGPPASIQATGTEGPVAPVESIPFRAQQLAQQSGRETIREGAMRCAERSLDEDPDDSPKSLAVASLSDVSPSVATQCQSTPSRLPTPLFQ